MSWQPIESAPQDTDVLVANTQEYAIAFHDIHWCNGGSIWSDKLNFRPTHWMPLPKLPTYESTDD